MITQISSLLSQQYPIRFGVVLTCDHPDRGQVDICSVFASILKAHGGRKATSFLFNLASHVLDSGKKKVAGTDGGFDLNLGFNMYGEAEGDADIDFSSLPPPLTRPQLAKIYAASVTGTDGHCPPSLFLPSVSNILDFLCMLLLPQGRALSRQRRTSARCWTRGQVRVQRRSCGTMPATRPHIWTPAA